jgi:hypothetical protein
MEPRTKRTLLGCAAGCGVATLLLVGSCVGFTVWLRAPGKLLEPKVLLDPEAVGYLETRLELDNPGTEALVSAVVELMKSQQPPTDMPLMQLLFRWNVARQERDLRRAFPARLVWTVYPTEPGLTESIGSISIQRAGHQLLLADWLMELGLGRAPEEVVLDYGGERVLVMRESSGADVEAGSSIDEPGEPGEAAAPAGEGPERAYYLFLRGEGAFFATGERAVRRAIDLLEKPALREGWGPSRLGTLLAELPEDRQLRGALLNPNGELLSLLEPILDDPEGLGEGAPVDGDAWRRALSRVDALSVSGGFETSGDIVLELELQAIPGARAELLQALRDTLAALAEEHTLDWESRETGRGVAASLRLRDVPRQVREAVEEREGRIFAPETTEPGDGERPESEAPALSTPAETGASPPS